VVAQIIDLIRKKRDGLALSQAEINAFVQGVTDGSAPDYQLSAFLMSVYLNGMSVEERVWLTQAMVHSGDVLDLSHLSARKVDKHSTGGVGDKVSLCLAPAVAACGVVVPMVSGRGLGHTGGTLDKLESIPGFKTRLSTSDFLDVVNQCGLVFAGQSDDIAPADRRLYALRDVTATVESLSLITSSIMSKKLAEGIDGLVLDVKVGSGAFMKTLDDARALAGALISVGKHCGVGVTALLTDMDQPLGLAIGNGCEMAESIEVLKGGGPGDLVELTVAIGAEMLVLGGVAEDTDEGWRAMQRVLNDGSALERLRTVISLQDGDPGVCDDESLFPQPKLTASVCADTDGFINGFDTERLGRIVVDLGGGRRQMTDIVDPSVGIMIAKKRGEAVTRGDVLATIDAAEQQALDNAIEAVRSSIDIGSQPAVHKPLILEVLR
jgi:pyrimidine-nucleoside phosphorylase